MSFVDLIKNAIFEEEPPQPGQPVRPAQPVPAGRPSRPSPAPTPYVPSGGAAASAPGDNEFYARLLKQTDMSAVPELAKIESFAAPLGNVIQDRTLRYKAAMATAQSQGLTKTAVMKAFDTLLSLLESSATSFNNQSDEIGRTEVDSKSGQVADLNSSIQEKQKEIADMQQQVKNLQAAAETARTRLQKAKANFAAAYERRKSEIQQQRKDFESILSS